MIETESFGRLPDGAAVTLYRIRNGRGESVELLDYGASIHAVRIRDGAGRLRDVTLGAAHAGELAGFTYEGVTIGRVANRIPFGRCTIEGTPLQLDCNHRGHFLHGGSGGYAHRFFRAVPLEDGRGVAFFLRDDGAGGFGCPAAVEVRFCFGDDRALRIDYRMTAGGTTVFCPTNHVYFDLSGQGDILHHRLRVAAARWTPKGPQGMPQGAIAPVDGTPMDYRRARPLGQALCQAAREGFFGPDTPQMDDTFLLDGAGGPAAELCCPASGIAVRVDTDMPAMVAFTPFCRTVRPGKGGRYYAGYCGVALETQYVPNAVNCPEYELPVFHEGETFASTTSYTFLNIETGGCFDE